MKKKDLYDYIEDKVRKQKQSVIKEMGHMLKLVKDEIRMNLKGADYIAQKASVLEEMIGKAIQQNIHYDTNTWGMHQKHRHITEIISFENALTENIYNQVVYSYLVYGSNVKLMEQHYPEVKNFVDSIQKEYAVKNERKDKMDRLYLELNAVIKSSSTGDKAYKNLVALGVDMSDFAPETTHLPVVQKLSEDVCLVNGGC